jgi:multiple sugar transport system substrate-binding protein
VNKHSALLRVMAALAVLTVLAMSLGPGAARAQRSHGQTTLQFWVPSGDPLWRKFLLPYIHQFEQSHPGITVNYVVVGADNNWVKYTTAMAAGRGPDVIFTWSFNPPIPEWAANGLIQPVDPWFKRLHVSQEQWLPWVWRMQLFHGHVWGFMEQYDTALFIWNKDDFKKAGLDPNRPPRTIAELDADARKLTRFDKQGNLVQAGFIPWYFPTGGGFSDLYPVLFGGSQYDQTHHKYTLNTPANVRALAWVGQYAKLLGGAEKANAMLSKFTGNNEPFYTGQVAMAISGEWAPFTNFKPYAPHLNYGVAAPPTAPGVPYGTNFAYGGGTYVMPVSAKHPDEAAELMVYMMQPDPLLAWCIGEANMPPTKATTFSARFVKGVPTNAWPIRTAQMALKDPRILPSSPTSSIIDYVSSLYATVQQEVEFGKMPAKAALDQMQQQVDLRLQKEKSGNPAWYAGGD